MPKPWGRYQIGYTRHAKFLALTGNAFALWWEAKDYCDEHHTDGMFPREALRTFRFNGGKSVDILTRSCGLKPNGEPYAPLWEPVDVGGVPYLRMHDYLVHNDCRDEVLERLQDAEDKAELRKLANRDRQRQARANRKMRLEAARSRDSHSDSHGDNDVTVTPTNVTRHAVTFGPTETPTPTPTPTERVKEQPSLSRRARESDDDLGDRARELLEHYPVWFAQERRGARLPILGGSLQWEEAKRLCATWDDARLEKLARVILNPTDDPFIEKSDRGWKVFVLKASWADDRLKQWEITHGVAAV